MYCLPMKIEIGLSQEMSENLEFMSKSRKIAVNDLINAAIENYIDRTLNIDNAFGQWSNKKIDGLDFQNQSRNEW